MSVICDLCRTPQGKTSVMLLLSYLSCYMLSCISQVRQEDVLSSWSGIRPLAADPTAAAAADDGVSSSSRGSSSTSGISRDHIIFSEPDGLVTVTGAHLGLGLRCWFKFMTQCLNTLKSWGMQVPAKTSHGFKLSVVHPLVSATQAQP